MTAQLPPGLISVVSASHSEIKSTDPADIIFERKQALFNFWKVHDAQSRTIQDASNIRCRQLFWRVWGNPRLSITLSQNTMMRLWIRCQQQFDFSPFQLQILHGIQPPSDDSSTSLVDASTFSSSRLSQISDSSESISPGQIVDPRESSLDGTTSQTSTAVASRTKRNSSQNTSRPALTRKPSGNDSNRKRSSVNAPATRGKSRPSMPRKKSSQSTQTTDSSRSRRSTLKSPTLTTDSAEVSSARRNSKPTIIDQITQSPTGDDIPSRKISVFELPSVSSWQSVESHPDPFSKTSKAVIEDGPPPLKIDRNFRERFNDTQNKLKSSTNLAGMNRAMRKTGSVVRFADEVDASEDLRKLKGTVQGTSSGLRTASEGQRPANPEQPQSWRKALPHRDSVGSVAAISDEDSDGLSVELPRTKSQLSLGIANLKRSQSIGEVGSVPEHAVTSPEIEQEQEALISGAISKKKTQEEEKLLAMAHKDGVTKAGGVNMPKELTVKGTTFEFGSSYESPDEPLY